MTGIFMGSFSGSSSINNTIVVLGSVNSDPFIIETQATNSTSYLIQSLNFNTTNTETLDGSYVVMDAAGPSSVVPPAGGTANYSGSGAVFGFTFTSFNTGDSFRFTWDADSAIDPDYGAQELDFIDGVVTATTSGGNYSGTFVRIGSTTHVQAILTPV